MHCRRQHAPVPGQTPRRPRSVEFELPLLGLHNVRNALAAIAVATEVGVSPERNRARVSAASPASSAVSKLSGTADGVTVYDDFAHHPTAVAETLAGLRASNPTRRIWAVFEPRSASSCRRVFQDDFARAFAGADRGRLRARVSIDAAGGRAPVHGAARRRPRHGRASQRAKADRSTRSSTRSCVSIGLATWWSSCRTAVSAAFIRSCCARSTRDALISTSCRRRRGVSSSSSPIASMRASTSASWRLAPAGAGTLPGVPRLRAGVPEPRRLFRSAPDRRRSPVDVPAESAAAASDDAGGCRYRTRPFVCRSATAASMGRTSKRLPRWPACRKTRSLPGTPAPVYRVFMLGFAPGFAYMGPVDSRIAAPASGDTASEGARPDRSALPVPRQASIRRRRPAAGCSSARTPIRPFDPTADACLSLQGR